jgi:hypothetical protein
MFKLDLWKSNNLRDKISTFIAICKGVLHFHMVKYFVADGNMNSTTKSLFLIYVYFFSFFHISFYSVSV